MINQNFGILAAVLALLGSIDYAWDTIHGKAKPNKVTWLLWAIAPLVTFAGELSQHTPLQVSLLTFAEGFGPFLVFLSSFFNTYAYWRTSRYDAICGIFSLLALILWVASGHSIVAVIFGIFSSAAATLPTITKSYRYPKTESPWDYILSTLAAIITMLTIKHWTFANYGFPAYLLAASFLLSLLVLVPRSRGVSQKAVTEFSGKESQYPVTNQSSEILPVSDAHMLHINSAHDPTTATLASQPPIAPFQLVASSPTQLPTLRWEAQSKVLRYNIYRNGKMIDTVTKNSYSDNMASNGMYTYQVTALNEMGESEMSSAVSVSVDKTPPSITYALSQQSNKYGWFNRPVEITFYANDPIVGIASCSAPIKLDRDGINQYVTGSAVNKAGDVSNLTVLISIDQTPPTLGAPSWSTNPVGQYTTTTLIVPVVDHTSGVVAGEYMGSVEHGVGHGIPMRLFNGSLVATFTANIPPGSYPINVRAIDAAGNWSELLHTELIVLR